MISLCLCCFNRYPGFGRIFCSLAVCSLCVCWCELPRIGALMLYEHMRFISLYGKSLLGLRSVEAPSFYPTLWAEKQGSALRKLHQAEGPQQRHDGTLLTMFTDVWQLQKLTTTNISKTVLVPLYDTSLIQARRDISFGAWAQRRVEVGCSKCLGIIVGSSGSWILRILRILDPRSWMQALGIAWIPDSEFRVLDPGSSHRWHDLIAPWIGHKLSFTIEGNACPNTH